MLIDHRYVSFEFEAHLHRIAPRVFQKQPTSYFFQKGVLFFQEQPFMIFITSTKFPGGLRYKEPAQVI